MSDAERLKYLSLHYDEIGYAEANDIRFIAIRLEALEQENAELKRDNRWRGRKKMCDGQENGGRCWYAGPGRGDCKNFIGLPGVSIPGQHDGPDDTVDAYGKPNGWCWFCWQQHRLEALEKENADLKNKIAWYENSQKHYEARHEQDQFFINMSASTDGARIEEICKLRALTKWMRKPVEGDVAPAKGEYSVWSEPHQCRIIEWLDKGDSLECFRPVYGPIPVDRLPLEVKHADSN